MRIAVATEGERELEGVVSNVFGRTRTFTIIEVEEGVVRDVKVIENPG